ncbi:hypothetical protein, partial [Roseateles sp.]|uniref:hypothetical protein n=1 Tax=Roseateles sp. TaxID=1971397 RepID=UPI002F42A403
MAQDSDRGPGAWWTSLRRRWLARREPPARIAAADEATLMDDLKREAARAQRHRHDGVLMLLELDPWSRLQQQYGDDCILALDERLDQLVRQ